VLATAAILKFLFMYNQYLWPLIVVQEEAIRPSWWALATSSSSTCLGRGHGLSHGHHRTGARILPVLQRAFIASIASTGVKG
jgi:multiple sugar transport system permease protein